MDTKTQVVVFQANEESGSEVWIHFMDTGINRHAASISVWLASGEVTDIRTYPFSDWNRNGLTSVDDFENHSAAIGLAVHIASNLVQIKAKGFNRVFDVVDAVVSQSVGNECELLDNQKVSPHLWHEIFKCLEVGETETD